MTDKTPQVDPMDDDQELDAPQQRTKRDEVDYREIASEARKEAAKRRVEAKTMKAEFSQQLEQQNQLLAKLNETIEAERKARLEIEARLEREKSEVVRSSVASKYGLPAELAKRLQGSTPEELEADAAALANLIPKANTKPGFPGLKVSPGNSGDTPTESDLARQVKERIGGGRVTPDNNDFWSTQLHIEKGGGLLKDD